MTKDVGRSPLRGSGSQASPGAAEEASPPSVSIPNAAEARAICERFALRHKVIFNDEGECGFGRQCVGFSSGDTWIAYHPDRMIPSEYGHDYEPIPELRCDGVEPPAGVNAYHKHDCLAVLWRGDEAVTQLAQWVLSMEAAGEVEIVEYATGATGFQAILSGVFSRAVIVRPASAMSAGTAETTSAQSRRDASTAPAGGDAQ